MPSILNTRKPESTRTIRYTNTLQARMEILDLPHGFTVHNGEFDSQTGTLTVYSINGAGVIFERTLNEGDYFMRLAICNIMVALRCFPTLPIAIEKIFGELRPSGERITRSFIFAQTETETKVVHTN